MTDERKSKKVCNAVLGAVAIVLLGLVGCLKRNDTANGPDKLVLSDVINFVVAKESLAIPEQFKVFQGSPIASIIFIDGEGNVIPFSIDGAPRDLCPPSGSNNYGSRTCKQEISLRDLTIRLRAARDSDPCGSCIVGGVPRSCRKSNDRRDCETQKFSCGGVNCASN